MSEAQRMLSHFRRNETRHNKHPLQRKMLSRFMFVCAIFTVFVWSVYYLEILDRIYLPFLNDNKSNQITVPRLREVRLQHYPTAIGSKTKPPFYPLNGTGKTVNISRDFENERLKYFCETERDLEAIVPVYSAPENFERRKAIRETVGKVCAQLNCKVFFIVGVSLHKVIYDKVKEEHLTANDILIVNKVDSYRDLNDKAVAMLDWLIDVCWRPKYVIHIIDDCYPNLKLILEQLHSIKQRKFILGFISRRTRPTRKPSKVQVTNDEYPHTMFPSYATGVVYAFLNKDSVILRRTLHAVAYCWVEDVWFTGHVREGAGFKPIPFSKPYTDKPVSANNIKSIWNRHSGIHQVDSNKFYVIYDHTRF